MATLIPMTAQTPRPATASALLRDLAPRTTFVPGETHCAVSGGADSLALMALAIHTQGASAVTVWHIDHGLRDESFDEGSLVEAIATSLGARFEQRSVSLHAGANLEARARLARYQVLPDSICTGHTADDVAESVLMNLVRGAGFDGMSPMQRAGSPRDGQVVHRPIVGLRRAETKAVCEAFGWSPVVDSMNDDPRFLRSRVRHEVLPLLNDLVDRDVAALLARSALVSNQDVDVLEALAGELDPTDARALSVAPIALARRALRRWLLESGVDPDGHPSGLAALDRALGVARGEAVACEVGHGWRLARSHQRLSLARTSDEKHS